ncbi:MAG: hypothetical protein RBQ99_07525 [Trichlorobacter sp.]|nr:hypothetical protein [Trichlorobacter sp.]
MQPDNIFEAKYDLSDLVETLETGKEDEIIIARNGRPVARLALLASEPLGTRLGIAKGKFVLPESFDDDNSVITKLFTGCQS